LVTERLPRRRPDLIDLDHLVGGTEGRLRLNEPRKPIIETGVENDFPYTEERPIMTIADDVYENTSDEMSVVIAGVLDDEGIAQPAALEDVRQAILAEVKSATIPLNRFSPDEWQQLRDEIDNLIEEYGSDALAVRFLRPWASDALGLLIEAGLDELGTSTLSTLFEAAEDGLLARLIGRGDLDDDEAQTVLSELQDLIRRHGEEALAEDFLGSP
jgi:hypothetical protein